MSDAYERLKGFLEAWGPLEKDRPRSPSEPDGIAGAPGADGSFHELLLEDLSSALEELRAARDLLGVLPLMEAMRLRVASGDIVMICPRESSLTPNQAHEVQDYLRAVYPNVDWLVLPLPADLAVLTKEEQ